MEQPPSSNLPLVSQLPLFGDHSKARAVSPDRTAALDDSVFVETALVGSFSSSYMFTLSGPAEGAGLDCLRRTPSSQTQAGRGPAAPAV
jgi:hypothetical protein